ncbi:amylo-alpha-1,6-glucosidase [Thioalkalivibrio sp. HK1]|uniref:amylo-alpha-1,6-glucosidase n=1 Tax=Thioalkalivibrio sp. HK1 TaxID=1469245 RepID=UPI000471B0AA|nr:trehalase family glycosidase [Thioalkalivibrio sp. HK1]
MSERLLSRAFDILERNDMGGYTVPTHGLYPFQWNWDSCLVALGQARIDLDRAFTEIETLFAHQWEDGMVPHIVFHRESDDYFPGPAIWDTKRTPPTSGLTQPPVAAFVVRRLFERAPDDAQVIDRTLRLLPRLFAWHRWFFECRDPQGTGLAAIIHPWETGRDNSVDWDEALARIEKGAITPFTRRDTSLADPSHRPTREQYEAYLWLIQLFKEHRWDHRKLHDASPLAIVDPGFNAILLRSISDLADLAERLGEHRICEESRAQLAAGIKAMEGLWSEEKGRYLCFDRIIEQPIESDSIAGLLAIFAPLPRARASSIADRIRELGDRCDYLIPSHDPTSGAFESSRYWRGPVWLIVNYMIRNGLIRIEEHDLARRIERDSLRLVEKSGFGEYYDPIDGNPCGGSDFTWTAAMTIELLMKNDN